MRGGSVSLLYDAAPDLAYLAACHAEAAAAVRREGPRPPWETAEGHEASHAAAAVLLSASALEAIYQRLAEPGQPWVPQVPDPRNPGQTKPKSLPVAERFLLAVEHVGACPPGARTQPPWADIPVLFEDRNAVTHYRRDKRSSPAVHPATAPAATAGHFAYYTAERAINAVDLAWTVGHLLAATPGVDAGIPDRWQRAIRARCSAFRL